MQRETLTEIIGSLVFLSLLMALTFLIFVF
jgi:hypothetical protein